MWSRTISRAVVTLGTVVMAVWTATGTAGAAPPGDDVPYSASTATTVVGDGSGELSATATVRTVEGSGTVFEFEVFVAGHDCRTTPTSDDFSLTTLQTAAASGTYTFDCTPAGGQGLVVDGAAELHGSASVTLSWTGIGDSQRVPLNGHLDHCVGRFLTRAAEVTGSVTLRGDVGSSLEAQPEDSRLLYEQTVCPPDHHQAG